MMMIDYDVKRAPLLGPLFTITVVSMLFLLFESLLASVFQSLLLSCLGSIFFFLLLFLMY